MRLCVFCGSSSGNDPAYVEAARALGQALAAANIGLVYGGASIGLMGAVADAVLDQGGTAIGVLPKALFVKELAHTGLTTLHVVESMHERKALMAELSDGFIALPGGLGTFEELFEVWTWAQLGYHPKPCALLDVNGFYAPLIAFLDGVVERGFVQRSHRDMLLVGDTAPELLARIARYEPPAAPKWIGASER